MNDFNVTIKVKNNKLLKLMHLFGHTTAASLYRACSVHKVTLGEYINLKATPYCKDKVTVRSSATTLCKYFGCIIDDIFPADYIRPLKRNNFVLELDAEQVAHMVTQTPSPEDYVQHKALRKEIDSCLDKLLIHKIKHEETVHSGHAKRDMIIFKECFGLDGNGEKQYADVARAHNLSRMRVSQICAKTLRVIRHPSRSSKLRTFL